MNQLQFYDFCSDEMIDREKRDILARQLKLLATGKITNDAFEDAVDFSSNDRAIWYIFRNGAWPLYDDLHEHKLVGRYKLPQKEKRNIAQSILFLKSNREYQWIEPSWWHKIFLVFIGVFSLGSFSRPLYLNYLSKQGDVEAWPYLLGSELDTDKTLMA